jgi:hypothetical protein
MGRGLSELQKTILQLAYKNHVAEGRTLVSFRVFAYEALPPAPVTFTEEDCAAPVFSSPIEELQYVVAREEKAGRFLTTLDEAIEKAKESLLQKLEGLVQEPFTWKDSSPQGAGITGMVTLIANTLPSYAEAQEFADQLELKGVPVRFFTHPRDDDAADLFFHEVLFEAFGFHEGRKLLMNGRPTSLRYAEGDDEWSGKRIVGAHFFSKEKIGASRYNAATVATSKAFKRLEERGLAIRRCGGGPWRENGGGTWMGICLTLAGFEVAKELSANTVVRTTVLADRQRRREVESDHASTSRNKAPDGPHFQEVPANGVAER